jgi:glyoxylase I family protein
MADFILPARNSASPFADMRGHHVAVRTPDLETAKRWYVEKLDFRVVAEWDYADEKLAYIAPPTDDHFYIEILGGGDPSPQDVRPYTDLGNSLNWAGYHHFCLTVTSVDATVETLRSRGVTIVTEPFELPVISRRLAASPALCITWNQRSAAHTGCPSVTLQRVTATRLVANMSSWFRVNACATRTNSTIPTCPARCR